MEKVKELEKPEFKMCRTCKEIKEFTNKYFAKNNTCRWKLISTCKNCRNEKLRQLTNYYERIKKPENYTCITCKIEKPYTQEHFRIDNTMQHNLSHRCKKCQNLKDKFNNANKSKLIINETLKKKCTACKNEYPQTFIYFYKDKSEKDGLNRHCANCVNTKQNLRNKNQSYKFRIYKNSAKNRGTSFDLTKEEFLTFWKLPCWYCSREIETIGIDRVNNLKGYTLENCVPCCEQCNRAKYTYTQNEFYLMVKNIYENHNLQTFKLVEV